MAEHGFAEEGGADGQAVEPADEDQFTRLFVRQPHLDGVGDAGVVEEAVGADDGLVDPGAGPVGVGARDDDLGEGAVGGDDEASRADLLAQGARHGEGGVGREGVVGEEGDDAAEVGVAPEEFAGADVGHREVPAPVRADDLSDEGVGDGGVAGIAGRTIRTRRGR